MGEPMLSSIKTACRVVDISEARRYLKEIRAVAHEGAESVDLRVTVAALRVLARQAPAIARRFELLQTAA
jgi:hypothetical protein